MSTSLIIRDVTTPSGVGYVTFHTADCPSVTKQSAVQETDALGAGYSVSEHGVEAVDVEAAERAYLATFDVDVETRRHACVNLMLSEAYADGRTYVDEGLFTVRELARRLRVRREWLVEGIAAFEALVLGRSIWDTSNTGEPRLTKDAEIDIREFIHRRR